MCPAFFPGIYRSASVFRSIWENTVSSIFSGLSSRTTSPENVRSRMFYCSHPNVISTWCILFLSLRLCRPVISRNPLELLPNSRHSVSDDIITYKTACLIAEMSAPLHVYIKIDHRDIGWVGMDWIDLAQNRGQWTAAVYSVMNLQVLQNLGKLLSSRAAGNFSRRTQIHRVS